MMIPPQQTSGPPGWLTAIMLLMVLFFFMLVINPIMVEFNNTTTGIIPLTAGVTDFEKAFWALFMLVVPAVFFIMWIRKYISGRHSDG